MACPTLFLFLLRVKQSPDLASRRVAACDVRSFMPVAVKATKSKIPKVTVAAMLAGNDVIDLKREPIVRKWYSAVLAAAFGPVQNLFSQSRIHCGEAGRSFALR
jgi:hypothetical protein